MPDTQSKEVVAGRYVLESKEGYIMGVLIKQSKYCYIWTNETIEDPDRVFETAKTVDPSNYIAY